MVLKQLEYLVALDRERHFGRAAAAARVSQPTLSAAIAALEAELGIALVERGRRFQGFTAEGMTVLAWARRMLADRDAMRQDISRLKRELSGQLRIGAIPTALPIIALITDPFLEKHPLARLSVLSRTSSEIQGALVRYELDVGVTYLDYELMSQVRTIPLYRERYALLTGDGILPPGRTAIGWAEAAGLPLCLLTPDMQNRRILDDAFRSVGAMPNLRFETNSVSALIGQVRSGRLASILPRHFLTLTGLPEGVRAVPLTEPEIERRVGLAILDREPLPPMLHAFLDSVRDAKLPAL
ncbi:MAG TPA: LysR substrate-binding domain-containing protein [Stellaceae bacterium]|jgi:DNA-binding transcriptional LysR family regulator